MKVIKSNPSKIIDSYILPKDSEIVINSIAESKMVKLTEISIMDKQSNGSFVVKDRVLDTYKCSKLISDKNEIDKKDSLEEEVSKKSELSGISKEYRTLKNIDEKIMSIDEILDDIEK